MQKISSIHLLILEIQQADFNQFVPLIPPWDTANFRPPGLEWPHQFLTNPIPIFVNKLLISMDFYQHAKNQVISSYCFRDTNSKILQPD